MTFDQTWSFLQQGAYIIRASWSDRYLIVLKGLDDVYNVNVGNIDTNKCIVSTFSPTIHDLLASDWEILI